MISVALHVLNTRISLALTAASLLSLLAATVWKTTRVSDKGVNLSPPRPNKRCSRQALFGCGYAAMVVVCLRLN
jgi:hypothetical protein